MTGSTALSRDFKYHFAKDPLSFLEGCLDDCARTSFGHKWGEYRRHGSADIGAMSLSTYANGLTRAPVDAGFAPCEWHEPS